MNVEGARGQTGGATAQLGGVGSTPLPVTVGLRPRATQEGAIIIRVRGRRAGLDRVNAQATTRFVAGRRLVLRIYLAPECVSILCGEHETCERGRCVTDVVDPETLPTFTGTLSGDAGAAPPDAMSLDGARADASVACTAASQCDDRDSCNGVEVCDAGVCLPGPPLNCSDAFVCTIDSCTPSGCMHVPDNTVCVGAPGGVCDPATGCQFAACTPATCASDGCTTATCSGTTCLRSSLCGVGSMCCGGACVPAGCDDRNPCTADVCMPTGCSNLTSPGAACSDGNVCTPGDTCDAAGRCVGGTAAPCNDSNACTDDSCSPMTGCSSAANTSACDDGSACTAVDRCSGGVCVPGALPNCDDGNPCTTNGCNPSTGCAFPAFDGPCDDGNVCTTGEVCASGTCGSGTPLVCTQPADPCMRAVCRPAGGCTSEVNGGAACDDGDYCTVADTCQTTGACVGYYVGPPVC